ncbi:MAG TPA: GNAT family N-acetyltransferase [Candidatus Kryptonia bacterium]|nr:GNAT family N-acetyltransferase [Candidatus Kryptonia bacterium]
MERDHAPEIITTDRLRLRRPTLADAAASYEYASDPAVTRLMDWPTHTDPRESMEFLGRCASRWDAGDEYAWVITVKPDDRSIGSISVRVRGHAADFGYVLNRNFWRRGYATEAARAVVSWVESFADVYRVWATCDCENFASVRVLEKAGLSREGILRQAIVRPNLSPVPRDASIFAKVRNGPVVRST